MPRNHYLDLRYPVPGGKRLQRGRGTCLGITIRPGAWPTKPARLQRGRGTCLGITVHEHGARLGRRQASKRPRHVPRNHYLRIPYAVAQGEMLQRGRGTCLGITLFFFLSHSRISPGFKEAEARASESHCLFCHLAEQCNASKRPRHVPRNHADSEGPSVLHRGLQRGRGTCLGITTVLPAPGERKAIASKRPRHVPRNHDAREPLALQRQAASKRPRHVPRNHFCDGGKHGRPDEASKRPRQASESLCRMNGSRFMLFSLQRGRGTCLGITLVNETELATLALVLQRGRGTCLGITALRSTACDVSGRLQRGRGTCLGITPQLRLV